MTKIFAHSLPDAHPDHWQSMSEHAEQVALLAKRFAGKFGAVSLGEVAGLLHDVGKYSNEFQSKLRGANNRVDHSTAGARIAVEAFAGFKPLGQILAYVIAGHHAGLANGGSLQDRLDRTKYVIPVLGEWRLELMLPKEVPPPPIQPHPDKSVCDQRNGLLLSVLTRMLFSALVDADRLDTEAFYALAKGRSVPARGDWQSLEVLKRRLDQFMAEKALSARTSDSEGQRRVNVERAEVLASARAKSALLPGLFSLTVPTGGGKTLASLTFALDHAVKHKLDRVIYVIPFTSIIEQTAVVFREALGRELADHVIEHHSAFREEEALRALERRQGASGDESSLQAGERMRLATENWDAPIVITTSVQFFESLFSDRPSQCRKLHNIARSVIILDEAQTLPLTLLRPCVAMLDELARNYSASIVLCTATQPALEAVRPDGADGLDGGFTNVREIVDDPKRLYETMRRVTVNKSDKPITDEQLVDELRRYEQVLCIVGTRAHARDVFLALVAHNPDNTFHLSALMCPAHRSLKLAEIKAALAKGPCRVVATTVVEAGVDIDFPYVYRAMAGLDSIAQAAGRCNREGKRDKEQSIVQLFEIEGRNSIRELRANEAAARSVLRGPHGGDPLSLGAIESYFDELYWHKMQGRGEDGLDKPGILAMLNERVREPVPLLPFEDVAKAFHMIDSVMEPVIISFDGVAQGLIAALAATDDIRGVARKLQPYIVNVPKAEFAKLRAAGSIQPAHSHRYDEQFAVLASPKIYSKNFGLDWSDPTRRAAEDNLF
jgi:CRISPR-associated endonuclease/helicase Cas3